MDILLMGVAAKDELDLRSGDEFAYDVQDVVANDAFSSREIADTHADDPSLDVAKEFRVAPLLDIFLHGNIFGLPMVCLHGAVQFVSPWILEREQIEEHGLAAIDDSFVC